MPRAFRVFNGPAPTTALQVGVTTGTALKTMLQLAAPATTGFEIKAWGVSANASAAATPPQWELLTTGSVGATVTAHVAAGLVPLNAQAQDAASVATLSTTTTGYTATAEGTITTTDVFDSQYLQPTGPYVMFRPLGDEFYVPPSTICRIRVLAGAAVTAICWIDFWE
jgi:hypothetical protein